MPNPSLSNRLFKDSTGQTGLDGMGCTIVVVLLRGTVALAAHLGDSRAYLCRGKQLEQLTQDHTVAQSLVNCGDLSESAAGIHSGKSHLTRYVGMPNAPKADLRRVEIQGGDRILLCTDGLTGVVTNQQLSEQLSPNVSIEELCSILIYSANQAGGTDNITILLIEASNATNEGANVTHS